MTKDGIVSEGAKATPPLVVLMLDKVTGANLNNMLLVVTIGYVCLQAAYLVWKWRRQAKRKHIEYDSGHGPL